MAENIEKEIVRTFKKPLIWVSIISLVVIVMMGLYINGLNDRIDYIYDNYDYSCSDGTYRVCITDGKNYAEYNDGEYTITIKDDETYAICDTDRKERAICIDEDSSYASCSANEWATCIGENERIMNCEVDENARCIKEDKAGYITSAGYIRYCDSGEYSTCA